MIRNIHALLFLCFAAGFSVYPQVTGTVTNARGEPLPYVNIYLEGSVTGTITNENGFYELDISRPGSYEIVFQYLGYQKTNKNIHPESFPFELNAVLREESISLQEVLISSEDNPANEIMRNAISAREQNRQKVSEYTAEFYSRGIWRLQNAPEKILGQEVGDLGGSLDSTRSGVIYLSETLSEIAYRAPDDFKEKILASKLSGNDNGFSLNSAREANISFYNNTVNLNSNLISPLADYAFDYYRYQLEGLFYTSDGRLINKILVTSKRPGSRVFSGYLYIEENSWQIYGVELRTTGEAMNVPVIEQLFIKQNYNFAEEADMWVPVTQTVDFEFGMFGITGNGRFTAVYRDYDFSPDFDRNTFSKEILSFTPEANKKDSLFWSRYRPIPLTAEESTDYNKKDSIQEIRNSRTYQDSVDRVRNRFRLSNLVFGYTYRNSFEDWSLSFNSPIWNTYVNTVQGFNSTLKTSYRKSTGDSSGEYWRIFSSMNYGLSEDRFRIAGGFQQQFNSISRPVLVISGGSITKQFNENEPISESINGILTNYFNRNYMKLYDLQFFRLKYSREWFNGFNASVSGGIEKRRPLFNNRTTFWIDRKGVDFTSNNPLEPFNYGSAPFEEHHMIWLNVSGKVHFGQEFYSYPGYKLNVPNEKYPVLSFSYDKGLAASIGDYDFDHLELGLGQELVVRDKGRLGYTVKAGTFFNDNHLAFTDYKHFIGNQTPVGTTPNYLDRFLLLPYYQYSTGENYLEGHLEHNFKGWILGRIPGINLLNLNLVVGTHQLYTAIHNPYREVSLGLDNIGFGKFRFLRLDYVVSFTNGRRDTGFIFGLKFLDVLGM